MLISAGRPGSSRGADAGTAVAVGSKAVLEVLPAALFQDRAAIGTEEVQSRSVVFDQEVKTTHLVAGLTHEELPDIAEKLKAVRTPLAAE